MVPWCSGIASRTARGSRSLARHLEALGDVRLHHQRAHAGRQLLVAAARARPARSRRSTRASRACRCRGSRPTRAPAASSRRSPRRRPRRGCRPPCCGGRCRAPRAAGACSSGRFRSDSSSSVMSEVRPNRCSTSGSSRNASEIDRNALTRRPTAASRSSGSGDVGARQVPRQDRRQVGERDGEEGAREVPAVAQPRHRVHRGHAAHHRDRHERRAQLARPTPRPRRASA